MARFACACCRDLTHPPSFDHRVLWVDRPTIVANLSVITQRLAALNVATVARPANRLQVVQVIEQVKVAFVWLQVVNDRAVAPSSPGRQHFAATFMLASIPVAGQCQLAQVLPLLGVV